MTGPVDAATGTPPRLAAAGLALRRGGRAVLEDVSFDLARGEILGILGPNGAGKSSMFQILVGLLPPDGGELRLDGVSIPAGDRRLRKRCGVVFQEPALDRRLSARENLRLAAVLHGVPRREAAARIERLLADAGLADRASEAVGRFSGGMRRKVEIARAILHSPGILVLDEPTAGLDEASFRATWSTLHRLRDESGLSMLVTTHRPDEAERCDRIALLDGGRIVACGSPAELRAKVRGDVLVLECDDPAAISAELATTLGIAGRVIGGEVVVEADHAAELVPRIVEAFPGRLRAVSFRRTGLGEVFLELTGHALRGREEAAA